jgi:Porin PorA
MRSRVTQAALFGIGVLALVFAAGLAFIVGPRVNQLPYDLERTQSVAEAPNATFLQIKDGAVAVNQGDLRSTVTVQPDADETAKLEGDLDGKAAVWLVGQQVVRTDNNELVSAYSTLLALDRKSANTLPWDKAWLDTGNDRQKVAYTGQIYKFPFGTEKKTYQIFDRDINAAQPAVFVKTEKIEGLETYQFTQEIRGGRQEVPADRLQLLLAALIPGATSGQIVYNNTRTVWVEPTTGQYIKVQEVQEKNLVADSGQSVKLLDATFTYTDETIADAADRSSSNRRLLQIVNLWAPIGLLVVGLILIGLALMLTMRRRNAGRHTSPPPTAPTAPASAATAA